MISMPELIHAPIPLESLPRDQRDNLAVLLERVNQIRALWGKPMTVTSGYRTMADHLRIYAEKGITDPAKIPMQSKHLYGQAVDISDPDLAITAWLKANPQILEDAGLWCEDGNSNWLHLQNQPPRSGNRWFLP
jgi:uncharacterized protein YcbK (DUF882 family)